MTEIGVVEVVMPGTRYERNFGVHATTHHTASRLTIRFSADDDAKLEKAAEILGLAKHLFIREAAVNMAVSIIKRQEKHHEAQHQHRRD